MLKKVSLSILSLTLFSTSTMADAPRQSPQNYNSASNYALQWALARNPNYISFTNDCTNFVSQALRTGGWKDTTTLVSTQMHSWFYKSGTNYAQTWSTANGLETVLRMAMSQGQQSLVKALLDQVPNILIIRSESVILFQRIGMVMEFMTMQ